MLEVGASNAIMNNLFPHQFELKFKELLYLIFAFGKGGALAQMERLDLPSKEGLVRLTLDPWLIDQLNPRQKESMQLPKILYSEKKNQIKFLEGIATSFDLRNAQIQLYNAQQSYFESMLRVITTKADLETVLNTPQLKKIN